MKSTRVFAHSGLEVREGLRGRGVFATQRFSTGEAVEVCPSVEVAGSDAKGVLTDYVFESLSRSSHVVLVLGYGMLYNHSDDPNLEYDQDDAGVVTFFATRTIEPDEELTITYGSEWWEGRGRTPVDGS